MKQELELVQVKIHKTRRIKETYPRFNGEKAAFIFISLKSFHNILNI